MAREAQSNRANPTPFLAKIYEIVDNPDNKDLVSWTANGDSFVVRDTAVFSRDLLPKYFKHNNFASFVRQLNNYGFRKLPDFDVWQHDLFKRGEKHLLVKIQRRKISAASRAASPVQVATSGNAREDRVVMSSPTNAPLNTSDSDIVKELKLLRKENVAFRKELHELKSMVQNVSGFQEDLADKEPANAFLVESSRNNAEESTPSHMEIDLNRAWVGGSVDAAHSSDVNPVAGLDLKL